MANNEGIGLDQLLSSVKSEQSNIAERNKYPDQSPLFDIIDRIRTNPNNSTKDAVFQAIAVTFPTRQFVDSEGNSVAINEVGLKEYIDSIYPQNTNIRSVVLDTDRGERGENDRTEASDDFKFIEGISAKAERVLQDAGINTYAQLISTSDAQLQQMLRSAGLGIPGNLSTWALQAEYAQRGDLVGLETFQKKSMVEKVTIGIDENGVRQAEYNSTKIVLDEFAKAKIRADVVALDAVYQLDEKASERADWQKLKSIIEGLIVTFPDMRYDQAYDMLSQMVRKEKLATVYENMIHNIILNALPLNRTEA